MLLLLGGLTAAGGEISFSRKTTPALETIGAPAIAAAWGDFDSDGRPDLAVAVPGGGVHLYRNSSEGLVDVSYRLAGGNELSAFGVCWGDYDNDGNLDLFVTGWLGAGSALYRNLGDGTFSRDVKNPDVVAPDHGMTAVWADVNQDGWLDLLTLHGGGASSDVPALFLGSPSGTFTRSAAGSLPSTRLYGGAAAFGDYDGDGDLDLMLVSSIASSNPFFLNDGHGAFVRPDVDPVAAAGGPNAGGGAAWGDFDNDGDLDLMVTAGVGVDGLYKNDGHGAFSLVLGAPGETTGAIVGVVWADFDNDGWLDLLMANREGRPYIFRNLGGTGFERVMTGDLANQPEVSNGIGVADYNRDGTLDVLMANWPGGAPVLYANTCFSNRWLRVALKGSTSNRQGIGAKIRVTATVQGRRMTQLRQIGGDDGWGTQEAIAHFGLGDAQVVESVRVEWPSGVVTVVSGARVNQVLSIAEALPIAPLITEEPRSAAVPLGGSARLSVSATGTPPLTYQWFFKGLQIAGSAASVLEMSTLTLEQSGGYFVEVSNPVGVIRSLTATLAVEPPPSITQHPGDQSVQQGASVTFTVVATSSGALNYQWQRDQRNIPGATLASLTLEHVATGTSRYRVIVSSPYGTVISNEAILTVDPNLPPKINVQPQSQSAQEGATVRFSVGAGGTAPIAYAWFKDGVRILNASLPELVLPNVQAVNAGSYTVEVSNEGGIASSSPAVLTVLVPPTITAAPISQTVIAGQSATLAVVANGSAPLSYQWLKDGTAIAGATQSEWIIANAQTANAGGYQVTVSNAAGSIRSLVATLTVAFPPSIVSQPEDATVFQGQRAAFSITVAGTSPISIQWLKGGSQIAGATSTTLTIASALFTDAGNYSVDVTSPYGAVKSLSARLSVKVRPNETLFDLTPGGGIVLRNPFESTFPPDSFVTLTAQPANGWQFLDWKGSTQGTNPIARVQMNYSRSIRARFGTGIFPTPAGNGTISVSPQSDLYPYGSTVQLVAEPGVGAYFIGWSGSVESLENPLNLVVKDAHPVLVAAFDQLPAGQASFIARADGFGHIVEVPRSNVFDLGQSVTNTAVPDGSQEFLGWTGDASGTQNPIVVTLDKSKSITAVFTKRPHLDLQSLEIEGFLLSLTGEFTSSFQLLRSTDLQAWDSLVTLTNAYGESQLIIPSGAGDHSFYRIGTLPVPKRQATAVCTVVNGFVVAVTVTDPGSGYTVAPTVEIVGSGSGATAVGTTVNGSVDKIAVISAGSGYTASPEVRVGAP